MKLDMDIKREITDLDLESPIIAEKKPISKFVVLSVVAHAIVATTILTSHYALKEEEKEVVEIQMADTAPVASAPEQAPIAEEAPAAPAPVVASAPAPTPAPAPVPVKVVKAAAAKPAPPATIDDIKTPTLDESPVVVAKESKLNPEELDEDLNQVDQDHEQKLVAAKTQIDDEASRAEEAIAKSTQEAEAKVQKEKEEAAALLAARADALKKEQEAAAEGEKNVGPGVVATEVRSLESLRQMPGNPKPLYEQSERLRGDKGQVVFQAFVTQDGKLTDFKLLQSTGHRNLDAKTLKALKQWKFYPGQEGWVELPFDWNLKGGAQEMPALLRRKVGQRP